MQPSPLVLIAFPPMLIFEARFGLLTPGENSALLDLSSGALSLGITLAISFAHVSATLLLRVTLLLALVDAGPVLDSLLHSLIRTL